MNSSFRKWALMTNLMMGMSSVYGKGGYPEIEKSEHRCGECRHCPEGAKRFCKKAGHNVQKNTPADKCSHFVLK